VNYEAAHPERKAEENLVFRLPLAEVSLMRIFNEAEPSFGQSNASHHKKTRKSENSGEKGGGGVTRK